jgi:hypothetical protein
MTVTLVVLEFAQLGEQYVIRSLVFGMVLKHRPLEILYLVSLAVKGAFLRELI